MGGEELARYGMGSKKHLGRCFSHHIAGPLVLASVSFLSPQQIRNMVNFKNKRFIWASILEGLFQNLLVV